MNIRQIRNATIIVEYMGKKFLIDPVLSPKGSFPAFYNTIRQEMNNPIVDLPMSIDKIINVDAVIVTHLHLDHFDEAAKEILPKDMKIFAQNEADANILKNSGFKNIELLTENTEFKGITLIKTSGEHGRGEAAKALGDACGVVFKNEAEKTLYVAGDTVWCESVKKAIKSYKPEIIVLNAGDNQRIGVGSLIMGKNDVYEVYKEAPNSIIIASHMEAMNHWTLSKKELGEFINEKGIESNILIPDDGESYSF